VNGDREVTFHLGRPQVSLLAMLAGAFSPVYPCHVSAAQMRTRPVGTGPFKFAELKQNESVKVVRNPDYWKKDSEGSPWPFVCTRSSSGCLAAEYERQAVFLISRGV